MDEELYQRAVGALYRSCKRDGLVPMQPSRYASTVSERMVILRSGGRVLAKYKLVKGRLKYVAE
jgi:hypothetical protein